MRALLKTDTAGWYGLVTADGVDPKKVRKIEGDEVYGDLAEAQSALSVLAKTNGQPEPQAQPEMDASDEHDAAEYAAPAITAAAAAAAEKMDQPVTVAPTGKTLVGKTIEITCSKRGCSTKRVIKPQDKFQVKFCVPHQEDHRKEVRRAKQKAKTAARRAQREAEKAAA